MEQVADPVASMPAAGQPASNTVVLVHGWPDDPRVWDKQVAALTSSGFQCHALWLPGYKDGLDAEHKWGYTIAQVVEYLHKSVLEIGGGAPVNLVLHDWGVAYGVLLEKEHPELVAKLVLADIGCNISPGPVCLLITIAYQLYLALSFVIGGATGNAMSALLVNTSPDAPKTSHSPPWYKGYPYLHFWATNLDPFDRTPYAQRLFFPFLSWHMPRAPTLFMYGTGGGKKHLYFHTDKWAQAVADRAGCYAVPFPDAGHWLQVDQPERFNALMVAYLSGSDTGKKLLRETALPPSVDDAAATGKAKAA